VVDGRIDLERARRDAKALARSSGLRLSEAQVQVARGLGASSWPALVRSVRLGDELVAAARAGSAGEVYRLLVDGAPPNARDASGATALHLAASSGASDVVDVLAGWVPVDRGALDRSGRTALEVAEDPVVTAMLSPPPAPVWDPGLAERAWEADAALFEALSRSPSAVRREVGDGFAFRTGLDDNTRNGVVASRGEDVRDWLGAPAQWLTPPGGSAPAGWRAEENAVFMAAPIAGVLARAEDRAAAAAAAPSSPPAPADSASPPAPTAASSPPAPALDLSAVLAAAEPLDLDPREAELLASIGTRSHVSSPAGVVTTFVAGRTLLGVHLSVAPAHRRRGIGRELVLAALRDAGGCDLAILAPTPATIPFYARLGFTLYRSAPRRVFYG